MRGPRIKLPGEGFYHVVSRIGGRRFLLDDTEKPILLAAIRRAAAFSGVEVYTHAIMDNHFHLLVRVPRKTEISDEELSRRVLALYGSERANRLFEKWANWLLKGKTWRVDDEKKRLRARMHDLSQFCKTFKETYTQDYNKRHGNTGTIWEGRFKSILLEGSEGALMSVAAYIHLNPVRAGMAETAADAQTAGFGAACAGDDAARKGLEGLVGRVFIDIGATCDWQSACQACENAMEGKMADIAPPGATCRATPPSGDAPSGRLSVPAGMRDFLRKRNVAFLHGKILGSATFLAETASVLPPRRRRPSGSVPGTFSSIGLLTAGGVRAT